MLAPAQLATLPPARVVVFTSTIPPVVGRAEQAFRRFDVRIHYTPQVWTVRVRSWLTGTVAIGPALGALAGLTPGAQLGTRGALAFGWTPAWIGTLAGGLVGLMVGWACGRLLVAGWRRWRRPAAVWLTSLCLAPARRLLIAWWTSLRARLTGRRSRAGYEPFADHVPALTHAGADLAEAPRPTQLGDPDA